MHEVLSQVAQPEVPTKTDSITAAELPSQSAMVKEEKVIVEKTQAPISGNTVTSKFSIQDFIKNKEVENTPIPELAQEVQLPNHHFTEMDLQAEWSYFLQQIQQKDIVTYNAINGFKITKKGEDDLEITYSSVSAKEEFYKIKDLFLNHFKHKVQHHHIQIQYKQVEQMIKKEVVTKRGKFEKWAMQNPLLQDLDDLMKFDFS